MLTALALSVEEQRTMQGIVGAPSSAKMRANNSDAWMSIGVVASFGRQISFIASTAARCRRLRRGALRIRESFPF